MAGKAHQKIAGIITRKMRQKGYEIVCYDGKDGLISNVALNTPPSIKKHRPDILGFNPSDNSLCIGEAKTWSDLGSKRTRQQFLDFSSAKTRNNQMVELIIGIPKSSENELKQLLSELNINNNPNVSYVWVPDELLDTNEKEL